MKRAMDVKAERASLIKELKLVNDPTLLKAIKHMVRFGLKAEGRISEEQYNRELEEAETRVSKGKYLTQQQVESLLKK